MIHNKNDNTSAKGAQASEAQPLGINAKSSPPSDVNPRSVRFSLLSEARKIFVSEGIKNGLVYPQNYHQTAKCIYSRFGEEVHVNKSQEYKRTFFTGVVQCGRVFTCPVCAAKIQERRRLEISKAFDYAYSLENKKVILVTFTFPHSISDSLLELLKKQSLAFKYFRKGNVFDKKKLKVGFLGLIRSLEVTFSLLNGWHPHTHEAWIVNSDVDVNSFRDWIANRWFTACSKAGVISDDYKKTDSFFAHSVQITDFASNSEYMAKMDSEQYWGADSELAKSNVKQAKGKGFHPYEFLNMSMNGDTKAKRLFLQFADAMRGKSQIFWSHGLKKKVGVDSFTDEELAQMVEDKADVLGKLSKSEWNFIAKNNHQSFVLDLAETSGFEGVKFWLSTVFSSDNSHDVCNEIPSETMANNLRKTRELCSFAVTKRKAIAQEQQLYNDKKADLKESIRQSTLKYFDRLSQDLTLRKP